MRVQIIVAEVKPDEMYDVATALHDSTVTPHGSTQGALTFTSRWYEGGAHTAAMALHALDDWRRTATETGTSPGNTA